MKRVLPLAVLFVAVLYTGEDLSVRYRVPRSRDPLGSVTVQRSYSVMQKNGKPDLYFDPPASQTCVRSLFPHLGYSPCWYLRRHSTQQVSM